MTEETAPYAPEPCLYITVGLPCSGKTTWALAQDLPIISPDAIRFAFHGQRFLSEAEPWVWTYARTMPKALFYAGHERLIVDATNTKPERRRPWIEEARALELRPVLVLFHTDQDECARRAAECEDREILPIIRRMAEEWHFAADELESDVGLMTATENGEVVA